MVRPRSEVNLAWYIMAYETTFITGPLVRANAHITAAQEQAIHSFGNKYAIHVDHIMQMARGARRPARLEDFPDERILRELIHFQYGPGTRRWVHTTLQEFLIRGVFTGDFVRPAMDIFVEVPQPPFALLGGPTIDVEARNSVSQDMYFKAYIMAFLFSPLVRVAHAIDRDDENDDNVPNIYPALFEITTAQVGFLYDASDENRRAISRWEFSPRMMEQSVRQIETAILHSGREGDVFINEDVVDLARDLFQELVTLPAPRPNLFVAEAA